MKESVAIAKEANRKKESSPTRSDNSIQSLRNEPERQLGSLRDVIGNIQRNGGTPSIENISTELSVMPSSDRASALLALQQTHGNQYVQRVVTGIQAKLKVGPLDDKYEQEADRVAEKVMQMPEPTAKPLNLQRQGVEEDKRKKKKGEELIMVKGISEKTPEVSDELQARLNQSRGSGQPLPDEIRIFTERRFGVDFRGVRVHTDSQAAKMAKELSAEAFTHGRGIYFGAGMYNPGTLAGKRLLAHELTHVVQQGRAGASDEYSIIRRSDFDSTSSAGDRLRVETDLVDPTGAVRAWATARIITAEGDQVPYHIRVDTVQGHRPVTVIVGVRRIATGEIWAQQTLGNIYNRSGLFHIPPHLEPSTPAEGNEFFVRLEPTGGEIIEYNSTLNYDQDAVKLARVLSGEGGGSLEGMVAVAHETANRIAESSLLPRQVDTSSPWPYNFINTAFMLRGGGGVSFPPSWLQAPSAASRQLAHTIIRNGRVIGRDPTSGALFHCTAGTHVRLESNPDPRNLFHRLGRQIEQRLLRRVTVGGNTFYGCGPRAGSPPADVRPLCRP